MTEPFQQKNVTHLIINEWERLDPNLLVGFTTKNGGFSQGGFSSLNLGLHVEDELEHVIKNKQKLSTHLSWDTNKWVGCEQIHENRIIKVQKKDIGSGVFDYNSSIEGTDGIYTYEKNILLTLCFADCVPLYFWSIDDKIVGLAHAGWKGTVKGIGPSMIEAWEQEGINRSDIRVAIGPAISSCCYEVNDYVMDKVKLKLGNEVHTQHLIWTETGKGKYMLNLQNLNKYLLIQAGIKEENIITSNYCTSCEDQLFFSHRRDKGNTGRMLSFIGLKEEQ